MLWCGCLDVAEPRGMQKRHNFDFSNPDAHLALCAHIECAHGLATHHRVVHCSPLLGRAFSAVKCREADSGRRGGRLCLTHAVVADAARSIAITVGFAGVATPPAHLDAAAQRCQTTRIRGEQPPRSYYYYYCLP